MSHKQVWVKVNAAVDEGVADLISTLNQFEGLQSIGSCQGRNGEGEGFVYFYYGDWEKISHFVFGLMAPALRGIDGYSVSIKIFNESEPMGKLSFDTNALPAICAALADIQKIYDSESISEVINENC